MINKKEAVENSLKYIEKRIQKQNEEIQKYKETNSSKIEAHLEVIDGLITKDSLNGNTSTVYRVEPFKGDNDPILMLKALVEKMQEFGFDAHHRSTGHIKGELPARDLIIYWR